MTRNVIKTLLMACCCLLGSCSTSYHEITGTCIVQEWSLSSFMLRHRQICELPPPEPGEVQVRDREPMDVNPFPDLFERNDADSTDPNLLEKARLRNLYYETDDPKEKFMILEQYNKLDEG